MRFSREAIGVTPVTRAQIRVIVGRLETSLRTSDRSCGSAQAPGPPPEVRCAERCASMARGVARGHGAAPPCTPLAIPGRGGPCAEAHAHRGAACGGPRPPEGSPDAPNAWAMAMGHQGAWGKRRGCAGEAPECARAPQGKKSVKRSVLAQNPSWLRLCCKWLRQGPPHRPHEAEFPGSRVPLCGCGL